MNLFLRGLLIGLLFGVPVGAVGTMTIHNTLSGGMRAGLLTGLGSSIADCIYACIGVFGFTMVSDFLLQHQMIIHCCGGVLILLMGLFLLVCCTTNGTQPKAISSNNTGYLISSFVVGITNPAAILAFLFAFSYFGITPQKNIARGIALVCGVFTGTYLWWFTLSALTSYLHKRTDDIKQERINRIFGVVLLLFGLVMILQTIFRK